MTVFAELSKDAMKIAVWAGLVVGFLAGLLRRRRG
jgi:hypothetical protein